MNRNNSIVPHAGNKKFGGGGVGETPRGDWVDSVTTVSNLFVGVAEAYEQRGQR